MNIYLGTFLIAFTTLALEVTLARLLSVITWYHLAFFAISTAMLGMTAGATTVYLKPNWFTKEKLNNNVAKCCLWYSLVIPITLIMLCLIPLDLRISLDFKISVISLFSLVIGTIACSLPFYFSGVAVTVILTKHHLPIGKLYASDLIGASLGCLFVLGGLEVFDAPSLILLCSSIGALAAFSFAWRSSSFKFRQLTAWCFIAFILLGIINSMTLNGIRPLVVKNKIQDVENYFLEKWNSYSRVTVHKPVKRFPQYWGPSPLAPLQNIIQYPMKIDGAAATFLRRFFSTNDISHLRFDVTNIAYYLRPRGGACIIGVGGGRDIQSAILFGHEKIIGIDVNPIFIDLMQEEFREFAGIADRKEVALIVDEARSFLSRTEEKYSIIQMSLIDTWAATGAGAFSLSENALYTVEAWQVFLNRLADDGIFTVSRWHSQVNLGETGRVVSLAVATLLKSGIKNPSQHIAMITANTISTLLVSKKPFSNHDISKLKETSSDLQFSVAVLPTVPPSNKVLREIVSANSLKELSVTIADERLNYEPPTDENPYFFNMLRLNHIRPSFDSFPGLVRGNLIASLSLAGLILSLFLLTMATIVFPLVVGVRSANSSYGPHKLFWSGALYFSLIGAAFMFVEIALIQRLSVFLGHPVYALGILLFTIIISAGVGSLISEYLPLARSPWIFIFPIITALAIILIRFMLITVVANMITSAMLNKIVISILLIFPLGMLMGFFFPTGMRLVKSVRTTETPWYWALNGIFGVLCSALAVFFSIYHGISTNFYVASICYATLPIFLYNMIAVRSFQNQS